MVFTGKHLKKLRLSHLQERLENDDLLLPQAILGALAGVVTGAIIIAFRLLIEWPQTQILPGATIDNYEALPQWAHLCLPFGSAILLGIILNHLNLQHCRTGLFHVVDRLHHHHGDLPIKNAILQFFGAGFAIAGGQSAGREGPAAHLGASACNWIGRRLGLPNSSTRMLIGAGVAAAIGASFNTPIAGVIFAMEVVLMEYTIAGFVPTTMAAVSATSITYLIYGSEPAFTLPHIELISILEFPLMTLIGIISGLAAAGFIALQVHSSRYSHHNIALRLSAAGLITGCLAISAPQILGIGYDTIETAITGDIALETLLLIAGCKLIATAVSCGLGMPIGFIGPTLVIGACLGASTGALGQLVFPELSSSIALYTLLGIGAAMAAMLNAPLAAILAVLELTHTPQVILPVMLAVVSANIVNCDITGQRSLIEALLKKQGTQPDFSPLRLQLQRTAAASMMTRSIILSEASITQETFQKLKRQLFSYLVVQSDGNWYAIEHQALSHLIESETICLVQRRELCSEMRLIDSRSTVQETIEIMAQHDVKHVLMQHPRSGVLLGVLSKHDIEAHFRIDSH